MISSTIVLCVHQCISLHMHYHILQNRYFFLENCCKCKVDVQNIRSASLPKLNPACAFACLLVHIQNLLDRLQQHYILQYRAVSTASLSTSAADTIQLQYSNWRVPSAYSYSYSNLQQPQWYCIVSEESVCVYLFEVPLRILCSYWVHGYTPVTVAGEYPQHTLTGTLTCSSHSGTALYQRNLMCMLI